SFYSLIAIFISSRTLAYVLNGSKDDKMLFIVSSKPVDAFRDFILNDLDRTATRIKSCGLYSGEEKEMLFLIAKNKEVHILKHFIKEIDPDAFVVVTDAYDTYGLGWKSLPSKSDIMPE
ncbi:MAG: YitT family protein, partial [Bacteroidaceae bacterium]|nr:YitT family protein [Bacteroidaceae bacterium]